MTDTLAKTNTNTMTQQEFLRNAMKVLKLSRSEFALRLNISKRRLDNWLLPVDSDGYREMDEIVWSYVREILNNFKK